jgi:hypothetical protein
MMSVWTTTSQVGEKKYIVLQHTLKGVNHTVNGIKFRDGYAVVEKDSKTYYFLKRIPVLKAAKEYPLLHLRNLHFITRALDIRTVYGQDVYAKFLQEEEKIRLESIKQEQLKEQQDNEQRELELKNKQEIIEQINKVEDPVKVEELKAALPTIEKCCYRTQDGTLCKSDAIEYSPSNYCGYHVIDDPKLPEFGLQKPYAMTKVEKRDFRDKIKKVMQKAKQQGKF